MEFGKPIQRTVLERPGTLMPYVRPALWTTDPNNWPEHGEIDIVEGVDKGTSGNQMTLHTSRGYALLFPIPGIHISSGKVRKEYMG